MTNPATIQTLVANRLVSERSSPFGLPQGLKGRLAGWYMSLPDRQHRELAALVPLSPRARVVEIGFGPGQTLRALGRREPSITRAGVDPSPLMVKAARRRNRSSDLHVGAAAQMPFPDDSADIVLSVNNVRMWPDIDEALREIRRVMAPHAELLVAWHGGTNPIGHQRKLVLDDARLDAIDAAFERHFPGSTRRTLAHSALWTVTSTPYS